MILLSISDPVLFFLSHRSYSHCVTVLAKPSQAVFPAAVLEATHLKCWSSLIIPHYHCAQNYLSYNSAESKVTEDLMMNYSLFSTLFMWDVKSRWEEFLAWHIKDQPAPRIYAKTGTYANTLRAYKLVLFLPYKGSRHRGKGWNLMLCLAVKTRLGNDRVSELTHAACQRSSQGCAVPKGRTELYYP